MISPRPPAGAETLKTDRRPDRKTKLTNATTSTIIPFIYPTYPQFAQMAAATLCDLDRISMLLRAPFKD